MEMSTKMPSKFISLRTFINVIKQTETSWRFTSASECRVNDMCIFFLIDISSLDRVSRGNNAAIGSINYRQTVDCRRRKEFPILAPILETISKQQPGQAL